MIGRTISHYRIVGKLGVGGMGVVYEADDTRLGRRVALKFLPDELAGDAEATRRFRREAQHIGALNHPHICTIYEIEEENGVVFIAMERIAGANLNARMARAALETVEIVDIALQITEALVAAHGAGIVHRDIKPGNIVVGESGQVKVLDFGLARRYLAEDTGDMVLGGSTIPGRPLGTANYMAPERILQLPLDPRSDLFSLGVVIYQMATGRLPFGAASPSETVNNVLDREPVALTTLAPGRPVALERIVTRLLAKQAEARYQSALELRTALEPLARPGTGWRRWLGW